MSVASPRIHLLVSAQFERCFAFAAVLGAGALSADTGTAAFATLWLAQARRRVDHGLRRRLGALAAAEFWMVLAEVQVPTALADADPEAGIDALASLAPADFARRFHAAGPMRSPDRFNPPMRRLVQRVSDDPAEIRDLAVDALRRFDRLVFASFWRQMRPQFETAVTALRPLCDSNRGPEIATRLGLDLAFEPSAIAETFLFPSVFAPEGFRAQIDGVACLPFPVGRVDHAPAQGSVVARSDVSAVADSANARTPDPALVFQALGDATRYAIAAMIAGEALTGAELARRLGIARPTVTHHLHRLRRAGLVIEQVRGNSIALRLDRRAIEGLSAAAVAGFYDAAGAVTLRRSRRAGPAS